MDLRARRRLRGDARRRRDLRRQGEERRQRADRPSPHHRGGGRSAFEIQAGPSRLRRAARRGPRGRHRRRRPLLPPHIVRCVGGGEILMNTTSSGGNQPMQKTAVLSFAAALLLAAGCQVDVTKLACTSSAECPTGYHCDMGTATSAGTFKCANGAAQQKTLAADATKFLLEQKSKADGTTRTTITADVGAVTSTPDLVGVRAIASQNGTDLASAQVLADGSVLQFQLPQASLQVDLRIEDDSGHSVAVTGYREHLELNFLGKNVTGNSNGMAAYDAVSISNSLYPPQTWIATGGPSGPALGELAATYTALADGGIAPPASYQAMQPPAGSNAPEPSTSSGAAGVAAAGARANGAMGPGGYVYCTSTPCGRVTSHRLIVGGGTTSTGGLTDHIYACGDKVFVSTGSTI